MPRCNSWSKGIGFLPGIRDLFVPRKTPKTYRPKYMLMIDNSFPETPLFIAVNRLNGKYWEPLQRTDQRLTGQRSYTYAEPGTLKTNQGEKEFYFES